MTIQTPIKLTAAESGLLDAFGGAIGQLPGDTAVTTQRSTLIGGLMPPDLLMGAMGISRTTQDSARIMGALAGAGLFALLGMGPAYVMIAAFYLAMSGWMH